MTLSHLHTVRTLAVDEADLTALGAARGKLSYLPFVVRASTLALQQFPALNSSLDERTQEIVLKRYYNIGVAVNTGAGLVVPVVKDAEAKTVEALGTEIDGLAQRAREGKLAPADVDGSTFTITSIGGVGTLFSFPIINVPDAAILGVHTIKRRPVVVTEDGQERLVVRDMAYLSLSFDHRLVDGFTAASFLRAVIERLEQL
jgi:pyruvate dehydrogenase E2 component (dihydrolipoamide acetyltransferase)